MEQVVINVLQEDINNGIPMSSRHCPIALAIKRELGADSVSVNAFETMIEITEKKTWKFWKKPRTHTFIRHLPSRVQAFVINFDAYNDKEISKPFSFELEI